MEHIAALLLIVGCADDVSHCRELPVANTVYEIIEECEMQIAPAISRFVTKHPQVFGQCVEVDPASEEADAELVWEVKPDGTLYALIDIPEIMLAAGPKSHEKNYVRQE